MIERDRRGTRRQAARRVCRTHVRTDSVTPCDSRIGGPSPRPRPRGSRRRHGPAGLHTSGRRARSRVVGVVGPRIATRLGDDPVATATRPRPPRPAATQGAERYGSRHRGSLRHPRPDAAHDLVPDRAHPVGPLLAVTSASPSRPSRSRCRPTSTGGSPTSTMSWSIVTVPAIRRRRPRITTSAPVAARLRGTPSAYPIGTVATWRRPAARTAVRRRRGRRRAAASCATPRSAQAPVATRASPPTPGAGGTP